MALSHQPIIGQFLRVTSVVTSKRRMGQMGTSELGDHWVMQHVSSTADEPEDCLLRRETSPETLLREGARIYMC